MISIIESAISALRSDSWENVILGLGGSKDPSAYTTFSPRGRLADEVLEALYVEDHFAARVVEAVPKHALRAGWSLRVPGSPEEAAALRKAYATREEELDLVTEMAQGACWGRVFGGAVTWVGADDGQAPDRPLDESGIESVRWLHTFDRRDVEVHSYYADPEHPRFRRPESYRIRPRVLHASGSVAGNGTPLGVGFVVVHESRCVVWPGQPTTDTRRLDLQGWDDSVISRCWDALSQIGEDFGAKSMVLGRISQPVFKIKDLFKMIAGKQKETLLARMSLLDANRARARSLLLDTDEDFVNVSQPVSGIDGLMDRSILRLAAAADMPVSILMGQAPGGEDGAGESDLEVWTATVDAWRALELRPRHERLARMVMLSRDFATGGVEPAEWAIEYAPLRIPTPKEAAEVAKLYAEADSMNIERGVYPAEVAAFRHAPGGAVTLDERELRERLDRRRAMLDAPPKDNAELGTVAPRNQAVIDVVTAVATGQIHRDSARAILTKLHRYTDEDAEAILGPADFVGALPPKSPGPAPAPQVGQGAGAPQPDQSIGARADAVALRSFRYRQLAGQLIAAQPSQEGAQATVAALIGVSPSYLSRILRGERLSVGEDVCERACRALRLQARYFTDPLIDASDYRALIEED